jgi:hypothetical protein
LRIHFGALSDQWLATNAAILGVGHLRDRLMYAGASKLPVGGLVLRYFATIFPPAGVKALLADRRCKKTPGRSMFVRFSGPKACKGAAGKWTDAATGEYGDLLDVIREACGFTEFADIAAEARRFLDVAKSET